VKVPEDAKLMFDGKRIILLATVDAAGMPNVVAMQQYLW
jgi:hypothetical protein